MNEREIFAEAMQKSTADEQMAFLAKTCGDDEAMRRFIAALIADQKVLGNVLENPVTPQIPALAEAKDVERPGSQIGPYRLLQVIGEGGMGVVYMAEQQQPVMRRVALKIIKPGMDTREVIARFEAERQAMAMMDHPNIAKVLDAGETARGRPFFVMELVKGIPITHYCDQQHLTPRQRLELFVPVCKAIQHAHQKGIIHRDLKPSNVLIALYDGQPLAKVIDFGVAKATNQRLTEKTMFTEFGQIIGTLEYMSPEQAELNQLDVDTRSDIYSLGVILYELLTGTTPFEKHRLKTAAFDEILQMIRDEDPPRPSTRLSTTEQLPSIATNRGTPPQKLSGLLRGELDWIVMKSLEKNRSRRYETANGLARDIERYLNGEPVQACPPSTAYLLRKYVGRHRGLVAAVSIVFFAIILGAIGTTAALMHAADERSARNLATENAEVSDRLAKAATKAETEAKAALTRAITAERDVQIATHLGKARAYRASGREGQRLRSLKELAAAAALGPTSEMRHELRDEAISCLTLMDVARVNKSSAAIPATSNPPPAVAGRARIEGHDLVILDAMGKPTRRLEHPEKVENFRWRPDGRYLATCCSDTHVYVWHVGTGKLISMLIGHNAYEITFSPQGNLLVIHSYDGMCRLWDPIRGQLLLTVNAVLSGQFSTDEKFIASDNAAYEVFGNHECRVLRHGEMGNRARVTQGHPHVYHLEFSHDSRMLASAGVDGVRVWDLLRGGREIAYLPGEGGLAAVFLKNNDLCTSNLASLARWRFDAPAADGSSRHWGTREELVKAQTGKIIRGIVAASADEKVLTAVEHEGNVTDLLGVPMGQGAIVLVNPDNPTACRRTGIQEKCWHAAISANGKWIAASSWSWTPPLPIQVFKVDSLERATVIAENSYARVRFSPDSQWLLCGSQNGYDLRKADDWNVVHRFKRRSHLPGPCDFSPDGRLAAICPNEEELQLIRLSDFEPIATLRPPDGQILSSIVRFSPDSRYLAMNTSYGRIFLWDLKALRRSLGELGLDW